MARTEHEVHGIGTVFITKKRGQRTLRLRVDTKGQVQVSMPWIVPKKHALDFILQRKDWILEQKESFEFKPYNGMLLGKTLKLTIVENSKQSRSKNIGNEVTVHFESNFNQDDIEHLAKVQKAIMKALRVEAEKVLLPRLKEFALEYGFKYKSSAVKKVVGRWGSCDSNRHILLSLFLIQLPIELIDYVLIHELAHTKHLNHSPEFWKTVEQFCPDYKLLRKKMRGIQPKIYDAKTFMS